ncbi:MAG TPA: BLUF domain-containing protein [Pedobacter sp.]|jgi:hypothetical protein
MEFFYLVYCSVPSKELNEEETDKLLITARGENELREITGMLLCLPEMYIQLIEGNKNHIRQLYANLIKDPRHYNVTILKEGIKEKRFFPEWSMGYDKKNIALKEPDGTFNISDQQVFELFAILDEGFG